MSNRQLSAGALVQSAGAAALAVAGGKLGNTGAVVLAYHDIAEDRASGTRYSVAPALFHDHLVSAMRWGIRFVDLEELTERLIAGEDLKGLASVTFDDGLASVHHHGLPILRQLGLPATVFAVSGSLGRSPSWWADADRVMTDEELAETASAGIRICSHSVTHRSPLQLDDTALKEELQGSRARLEDICGSSVNIFAYPYGHYDPRVRDAVAEAGYRAGYSFLNGRLTTGLDRFKLPRLCMGPWQDRKRLAFDLARRPAAWPDYQPEVHSG